MMKAILILLFLILSTDAFSQKENNCKVKEYNLLTIENVTLETRVLSVSSTTKSKISKLIVRRKSYKNLIKNVLSGKKHELFLIKRGTKTC